MEPARRLELCFERMHSGNIASVVWINSISLHCIEVKPGSSIERIFSFM
jgi:hypothetical protein